MSGNILLPYQETVPELNRQFPLLVYEKSRRIGLSYGVSPFAVMAAAAGLPGGMPSQNVFYIGYNLDMAREFITYCADFSKAFDSVKVTLPPEGATLDEWRVNASGDDVEHFPGDIVVDDAEGIFLFKDGSTKGLKTLRIDYPNGKSIAALPSTPRAVRGKQGIFIIDEAAFHDDLEGLIKAVLAALMWGGSVIIISTHDGDENYFNELITEIRAGKRSGHVERITITDALDQGLYKRICEVQGRDWSQDAQDKWLADLEKAYGDAADEELHVIPSRGTGVYMPRAMIEAACSPLYPVLRLSCPTGFERNTKEYRQDWVREWLETEVEPLLKRMDPAAYSFFGQDFARSSDLSVIAAGQFDPMANLICHFIVEMRNVPFREQKLVLDFICQGMPLFAAGKMDARGNGQQLAEDMVDDYGEDRIEAVMATAKTYLAMMPRLKARIEDRTLVIPKSEGVIDDLRLIKLVKGVPQIAERSVDASEGKTAKRHGDAAVALMHLVAAGDAEIGPFEVHRAGPPLGGGVRTEITDHGFGSVRIAATDDYQSLDGSGY